MLKYHAREREKAFETWITKKKSTAKIMIFRRRRQIASSILLLVLCVVAVFVVRNNKLEQFISFKKITAKNLDRLSEDSFRKIIGYDYGEKIYERDTAEIRSRLEASDMIFGEVQFVAKLIPRELEIKFREVKPLFVLMPQKTASEQIVYSDKGKIYPYNVNIADLPVAEAKKTSDIDLIVNFLNEMKDNDAPLYSRVSQIFPKEEQRKIIVYFNDVNFKTKFSLESDYWKTAFRHYRQLTRNMRVSNLDSISVLDLRFKQLAYTTTNEAANGGSHEH